MTTETTRSLETCRWRFCSRGDAAECVGEFEAEEEDEATAVETVSEADETAEVADLPLELRELLGEVLNSLEEALETDVSELDETIVARLVSSRLASDELSSSSLQRPFDLSAEAARSRTRTSFSDGCCECCD